MLLQRQEIAVAGIGVAGSLKEREVVDWRRDNILWGIRVLEHACGGRKTVKLRRENFGRLL